MQTEKTFATPKTIRYEIWEPTKAVIAEKDNAKMLNAPEMIKKPKK